MGTKKQAKVHELPAVDTDLLEIGANGQHKAHVAGVNWCRCGYRASVPDDASSLAGIMVDY